MELNNSQPQGVASGSTNQTPATPTKSTVQSTSTLIRLRTMKDDMADAIKRQNETLVTITLAEEKQRAERRKVEELALQKSSVATPKPTPKRIGRFVVIVVLVVVLIGLGFAIKILWPKLQSAFTAATTKTPKTETKTKDISPVSSKRLAPSLLPADSELRIIGTKEGLTQTAARIAEDQLLGIAEGTVKNLYFDNSEGQATQNPLSIRQFFLLTNISVPNLLALALENPFMVGLLGEPNSVTTPFVILKVSDKDIAVAGMLDLETSLPSLFDNIFVPRPSLANTKFRTTVISGKDARILEDKFGVIAYAFADPQTIVIARSKTALEKLIALAQK